MASEDTATGVDITGLILDELRLVREQLDRLEEGQRALRLNLDGAIASLRAFGVRLGLLEGRNTPAPPAPAGPDNGG